MKVKVKFCPLSSNELVEPLPKKYLGTPLLLLNTSHKMTLNAKISEAAWTVRDTRELKCIRLRKGKAVPLQVWSGPEGSRKLRLPDLMTTAQDGGLSALRTDRIYPQETFLVLISFRG